MLYGLVVIIGAVSLLGFQLLHLHSSSTTASNLFTRYLPSNSTEINQVLDVELDTNVIVEEEDATKSEEFFDTSNADGLEIQNNITDIISTIDIEKLFVPGIDSNLKEYLHQSLHSFKNHMLHKLSFDMALDDQIEMLSKQKQCVDKPIFLSMGRVSSPLYWQLIENYFYTMYTFHHIDCTVLICVTDDVCMNKCKENFFPCINYRHPNPSTHVMEQVASIKLYHAGLAVAKGVNLFLLDLDVGFLRDPMILFDGFLDSPQEQVRSQMDVGWGMDRNQGNTWMTFPRMNFGLFIVKSCDLTINMFERAWKEYQKVDAKKREMVASDQSVMQGAMGNMRYRYGMNFSYFYSGVMPSTQPRPVIYLPTLLLHKVERFNRHGIRYELGGDAAMEEIGTAVAVHATCYEKTTKLFALKATNAFWNTRDYYLPTRRTLTKPIMLFRTVEDLLAEIHSLALIAMLTDRALILPNILIGIGNDRPHGVEGAFAYYSSPSPYPDKFGTRVSKAGKSHKNLPNFRGEWLKKLKDLSSISVRHAGQLGNNLYWPAFRTISSTLRNDQLTVLEPAFYHKIEKQLFLNVPDPYIMKWDINAGSNSVANLLEDVKKLDGPEHSRLVLDIYDSKSSVTSGRPQCMDKWARDSASSWGGPAIDPAGYVPMPYSQAHTVRSQPALFNIAKILQKEVKICLLFLHPTNGNRTCFNKCN